jgi:hypothetical protein
VVLNPENIICGAQEVDLTIVVKWYAYPDMIPGKRVMIFTDLTNRFESYYKGIEQFYDYVFLVHNEEESIDNERVFYLPVGYCPNEHYFIENLKKDIDCLFIGTKHPSRDFLQDIDIIKRFGNEWGDTRPVYGEYYRNLCSKAKIIINHHYPGDTTNMRDYEAPNFKAMILTDKTPFTPNKDCVIYKDQQDLIDKINWYLENEDDLMNIAYNGYKTIKEGKFTYKDRIEELLKIVS